MQKLVLWAGWGCYRLDMAPGKERFPKMTRAQMEYFRKVGKKGGAIGGRKAALNMTPEQRHERAVKAAAARWSKKRKA